MAATAESKNYVQKMFIAFLGRAAAPDGLEYWGSAIDADPEGGKAALFDSLWNSAQAVSIYGGLETYQIVNLIFNNLFNRDAEIPGLLYWTNAIDDGDVNVLEAAAAIADAGAQDADGLASINAKTQAADAITAELEADPSLVAGYTSNDNFALARNSLGDVDAANVGTFDAATETANVAAGYSSNVTLSTGAETVTGTANFTDVVTGVVGTGATYSAANTITDPDTTDSDILNLSGDAGFTFGTVTNFEAVNVSLSDTVGSGFTIAGADNVTGGTISVDVADTVTVVGVELQGETVVSVTGALSSNLSTTDVTELTATAGGGAISISGDVDLATIAVGEIADDGTTITLENTAATVNLDGTADTNDTATISAAGTVTLDAGTTDEVEELTLSGNGAAVSYTISNVTGSAATYTIDGDQDVTLSGEAAAFHESAFSDSSTGTTSLDLSLNGADVDVSNWGVVSGGVELSNDFGGQTVSVASGNTVSVTAQQTNPLTIDANDTAGGTLEVSVGAALDDLVIGDFATATILTGNGAATMVDLTANAVAGNNDVDVTVAGTAAVAFTGAVATADLSIGGNTDVQFASVDVNGVLDVTGSGAVTATGAINAENDALITGDSVTLVSTVDVSSAGAMTITSTGNDVTLSDAATNALGDITVSSAGAATANDVTATSGNIDITATGAASTTGAVDASNDVSITGDSVTLGGTVDVSSAGSMAITSTANDVSVGDGAAVTNAAGDVTISSAAGVTMNDSVDATAGSIVITGSGAVLGNDSAAVNADNDVTITGDSVTMQAAGGTVDVATAGTLTITSTANDVTLADGVTNVLGDIAITSADAVTVEAVTATEGSVTITGGTALTSIATTTAAISASNDVTITSDSVAIGSTVTSSAAGTVTITSTGNDVTATAAVSNTLGDIAITSATDATVAAVTATAGDSAVTAAGDITTTGAISAENDVDITSTGSGTVALGSTVDSTGVGDITLTGGQITGTANVTAADGDITLIHTNDAAPGASVLGVVDATTGGVSIADGDFTITEVGANDAAGGGLTISGTADATITTASLVNSGLYLTTANDVVISTLDTAVVAGGGTGNYDLGSVSSSAAATVQITTGVGADSMTLENDGTAADKFLVSTGGGADTVTANETATGTVINTGEGDDTFAPAAGGVFLGTAVLGGDGGDTLSLDDGGDYSAMTAVTGVDIISLEGTTAVEISLDQLTTDSTFEVQGSSGTIIVDGNAETDAITMDLSNVTHQAGNQTGFTLTGGSGNDTITGAARDDVITGGDGLDTMTGGVGNDQFTYTATSEFGDTIVDFDSGADTIAFSSTMLSLGTGGAAALITTTADVTGNVFSGADLTAFLAANATAGSLASGTYKIIFIDNSGTDAGVYYVGGNVTAGGVATATTTATVALTGNAAIANSDFIVI